MGGQVRAMLEAGHDSRGAARQGPRSIMFWALLLSFLVGTHAARKSGGGKSSRDVSFGTMLRAMEHSESHLMELDDESFDDFLIRPGASRDFPVLVMFNAKDPKLGCRACQENGIALSVVATSYLAQRSPKVEQQPMVFAILDFQDGQKTFGRMELQTVPRMFLFKANESVKIPPVDEQQFLLQPPDLLGILTDVVRERTGVVINIVPDVEATVVIGAIAALLIAIVSYLVTDQTRWLLSLPHKRSLWFLVSISVYGFGVGGMVYCIIRRSPLYSWGNREIQLFAMHTNQDQFILEGMVVGFWNVMTGISFAMAVVLGSGKRNRIVQFVGVNVSLALAFYFLQKVMLTYEAKTRWYNIQGTLPKPVSEFLFSSIKKSTGLPRRLVRLSQLALWNYKDWATFKTKPLQSYLLKYVEREYGHVLQKIGIKPAMLAFSK